MVLILLTLAACGDSGGDSASPCLDAPHLTWANWADGFFGNYCRSCHSAQTQDRFGAPEGVDFDTLAEVRTWKTRIAVRVLDEQTMPVGGGVYEADLRYLADWLECEQ